jgi:adenylate cyclase class IV
MATNLELKARFSPLETGHDCARRIGARFDGVLLQRDTYFRVSRGRLKLRECAGKGSELIFYEREESADERWSRYERVPVGDSEGLARVLGLSGGILAVVEKQRSLYTYQNARIHLDEVAGLGSFLEFEVVGGEPGESAALMCLLREVFDIREEMIFRGSYSDMIGAKTPEKEY